jgi:hypothetical protein
VDGDRRVWEVEGVGAGSDHMTMWCWAGADDWKRAMGWRECGYRLLSIVHCRVSDLDLRLCGCRVATLAAVHVYVVLWLCGVGYTTLTVV